MDGGHKILIIDDDPDFVEMTRLVLKSAGHTVSTAADGDEGLRKMRDEQPDLVLLDIMMSWPLEGVSISREMMEQKELQRIPIIMITSIKSTEYLRSFPQDQYLHIDSWLDKPCSPNRLLAEVEATLARHERYRTKAS